MLHSQFLDFWISFWTLTLVVTSSFRNKTALHSSSRHHHVIIISSLESYRGELCKQTQARILPRFFLQICRQASFPLPYSHPPLPNPLLCCHPGGWRVNECFHQHLHPPRFGRSWGCLAPQAAEKRGEVRFWCNLRLSFLLQRFAPKELCTVTFCWGSFFLESFKKLIELYLLSSYIRSKKTLQAQPKSSLFHKNPLTFNIAESTKRLQRWLWV